MTWGGHFGWKDIAFLPWGATHLAAAGAEKAYDWGKGQVQDATGGGGGSAGPTPEQDMTAYTYGRDPNAANAAVDKAFYTGDTATRVGQLGMNQGTETAQGGQGLLAQRSDDAARYERRNITQGDFRAQNATLGQLGGLEAAQGPSAAQAQLQAGTNQAMDSQIALARSGRGFGGNAAAAGLAQQNMAGIQANQANSAAMLRAQEDAAWRGRQASNLGNVAGMQGQQASTNLQAWLAGQSQNDAMAGQMLGLGQDAYFTGQQAQQQGYNVGLAGVTGSLQGQQVANQIRGQEMTGSMAQQDARDRMWAAARGYDLQAEAARTQQDSAIINGASQGAVAYLSRPKAPPQPDTASSDIRAKTNIVPSRRAGSDFARGLDLDFDGTLYRPQGEESSHPIDKASAELSAWAERNGVNGGQGPDSTHAHRPTADEMAARAPMRAAATPMQQRYLGGGAVSGANRPELKAPDTDALDAASLDTVRNSPASFYDYKDPGAPGADAGRHYGPMAQDLAKTPAGASAVVKQPDGSLGVDTGRLALVHNGAIAEQQKQLDSLSAQLDAITGKAESPGFVPDFHADYGGRDAAFKYGRDDATERDMAFRNARDQSTYRNAGAR
jgi:hypothetical protein